MKQMTFAVAAASLFVAGTAAAQETTVAPRNTPGLPSHLEAVDTMLTGGLLNDPTDLAWTTYGVQQQPVQDASYPNGGALRITMGPANQVYDGGLNIPLLAPVAAGEQITIGFFARAISSQAADGKGRVQVRFQINQPPYPGFGEEVVEFTSEWGFYEVTTVASRAMPSDGIVALQFGLEEQVVEIGQAIVVSGTRSVLE